MSVYDPSGRSGFNRSVSKTQCAEGVWGSNAFHYSQCSRKGKIEEDGHLWCFQHAPSKVKAKRDAEKIERDKWWKESDLKREASNAKVQIGETAILYFKQQASHDDLEQAVLKFERAENELSEFQKTNPRT